MKQLATGLLFFTAILLGACEHSIQRMFGHNNHHGQVNTIQTNINGNWTQIDYWGEIIFNKEGNAIEAISPGGFLEYTHDNVLIYAANDTNGVVSYDIYVSDKRLDHNGSGKTELSKAVGHMISIGMKSQARVRQLYAAGGVQLVLAELERLGNSGVQAGYFKQLLDEINLSPADQHLVIEKLVQTKLEDHDKAGVTKHLMEEGYADSATAALYLQLINDIQSEHEQASLIKKFIDDQPMNVGNFNSIMGMVSKIEFGPERVRIIKRMIAKKLPSETEWLALIHEAKDIDSEHDKKEVLKEIAREMPSSATLNAAFLEALEK